MVDVLAAIRLVQWFRDAAHKELPKDAGDAMIFRVSRPARLIFRFWILLVGAFAVLTFFIDGIEWYLRAIYIPFFLFAFTQWPWAVVLDRDGISKRSYIGLRKTVPWPQVTTLSYDSSSQRFTVFGKPGDRIHCPRYLVSPATFYHEMYKLAAALGPMPTRDGPFGEGADPAM